MKIGFFEVTQDWEKEEIIKSFENQNLVFFEEPIQDVEEDKIKDLDAISVFIYSKCSRENLEKIPNLKKIATRSTGFDHIDQTYCKDFDIKISTVPSYGENTVAEFTMALLLSISRKLTQCIARVQTDSFETDGLRGFDIAHKTIGLIGFGKIGQKFAKICKGFEAQVIVYEPFAENYQEIAKEIGIKFVDIDTLYAQSDVISLHIPLLPQTKHYLTKTQFDKMKDGVVILNTSRGDLIKSIDLLDALNSKKVSAAGLDVLEGECFIKDELELVKPETKANCDLKVLLQAKMLIHHPHVIVTPHNAFDTIDALMRILKTSNYNINCFLYDKECENYLK